jgi:hypothetical protein
MSEINDYKNFKNSESDTTKTTAINNADNGEYSNNKYTTINNSDQIEYDRLRLIEPLKDFVRSDNTISSTNSRDLDFCFDVILREAVKEDKLVRQVFYTLLSAYSNNPINLAINAPSGEGKSYVLTKVTHLFPKNDVIHVTDMSTKALFHRNGSGRQICEY